MHRSGVEKRQQGESGMKLGFKSKKAENGDNSLLKLACQPRHHYHNVCIIRLMTQPQPKILVGVNSHLVTCILFIIFSAGTCSHSELANAPSFLPYNMSV